MTNSKIGFNEKKNKYALESHYKEPLCSDDYKENSVK